MKLSDFSINRPLAVAMFIIALVLVGLVSLPRLNVDLYPDMEIPVAVISTSYEGAAPAEVEKTVTKPIETAVSTVSNIKEIQSISNYGSSLVVVQFNWGTNVDNAVNDLREKLDMAGGMLPDGAQSPRTMKLDPNAQAIISLSVEGADVVKLKKIAEDTIKPRLERIEGVASASVSGGKEREIRVKLSPAKMESYGLSIPQVSQALAGDNVSGSAGVVEKGSGEISLRVSGEYNKLEDIKKIRVSLPGGNSIALSDIASIEDSFKKVSSYTFVNGEPSLGLDIMKASGANTVQVARSVHSEIDALNKTLPSGIKIDTVVDNSEFIQQSISNVVEHGLLGGLIAVLVLYLFLRNVRSTLVVALVIPISIIATFTMMYFGGQSINVLTMGGLVLGLGSLVDFSVVVLESIYRHREKGKELIEAAKLGTSEVSTAVIASASAQVVVFLPIVFVEGIAGILFGPMALTVSFSHIAALVTALTLVPMLSSKLLKNVPPQEIYVQGLKTKNPVKIFSSFLFRLNGVYKNILSWSLVNRKKVVAITVLLLVLSIAATPLIGTEFIPETDQGKITVDVELPPGTKIDETVKMASDLEGLVRNEINEVENIFTTVGSGELAFLGVTSGEKASLQIKLKPLEQRQISTPEAAEKLRRAMSGVPGAKITVSVSSDAMGPSSSPVAITIRGEDLTILRQLGDSIVNTVKDVEGVRNAKNSLDETRPEMIMTVDREKAARYGLSASQVLSSVLTSFDGQVVSRMRTGEDEVDIRLELDRNSTANINTLTNLTLVSSTGARVPLSSVADIQSQDAPLQINRSSQNREVSITADVSGRDTGSVNRDIQSRLNSLSLPEGYMIEFGGEAKDMAESFSSLGLALILSVVLVFMVMVAQFESLFQPFIIMFCLPPTFVGVILGLGITGNSISVSALLGAIMLIGIVMNNAIVLVDYVNTLRKSGYERNQAILEAGPVRLRPILMTALTTVLAILPMAFGGGEGSESQAPMAVVIAFGLSLSTLITLVLVPVVYTIFDDLGKKISGWRIKKVSTVNK
ncbi:RND multidrug efflux transporter [Desulfocucumis palustris]|uniref:RND multidrug efflux transporter n=1 Tax=Desulfocucumis palustris TaxID=1898651 RepID=A0A2L2X7Q7_9FIRM|nr:efflux RND transporter permease subunit [Desulfocucumis palustris]GBF32128.1 RND multidrug efflux transporter [Desulfocucumis palustris]